MNLDIVDKIVAAVLYEGYILYPYRASAVKNRQRFNFGTLYPQAFSELQCGSDASMMCTECLVEGHHPHLEIRVRFLHPVARQIGRFATPLARFSAESVPDYETVAALEIDDDIYQAWQEVIERDVAVEMNLAELSAAQSVSVTIPSANEIEPLLRSDQSVVGVIVRRQHELQVDVTAKAVAIQPGLSKLTVIVKNQTPLVDAASTTREEAALKSLASTHVIMAARGGKFISLLETPDDYANAVAACTNNGCWPVLVGDKSRQNMILASPIILYDYPQVAPESAGDFFDGTEIDEMLALRVMTLTDDEKREMRSIDARARQILERTSSLPQEHLMQLHGTMRTGALKEN